MFVDVNSNRIFGLNSLKKIDLAMQRIHKFIQMRSVYERSSKIR